MAAIGEQKATQLFAQLASCFEKDAGSTYEAIFTAWGGDVRERSVDLTTGKIRPRELALVPPPATKSDKSPPPEANDQRLTADPTVYARIDYLDPNAKVTKDEKDSCLAILKNLPVVFAFAPMNLIHYQVEFPAHHTRMVTVSYRQYAYADTRGSGSYQLAYVLHPATLWREFGPIHVTVQVPKGIPCKSSAEIHHTGERRQKAGVASVSGEAYDGDDYDKAFERMRDINFDVYQATLVEKDQKRGELFVGMDKVGWDKMFPRKKSEETSQRK